MISENRHVNLDDYARHLRNVNLTTLLISVGLVIGSLLSTDSSLRKAYSDLEILSDSIEKLDENWLYDYAIEIANNCFGTLDAELPSSIFVDLPLERGSIFAEIYLPKDKWTVTATKECAFFGYSSRDTFESRIIVYVIKHNLKSDKDSRLEAIKSNLKMQMLKPATVTTFKKLWDFISSPHHIYCASKLGESAILRIWHPDTDVNETRECRILLDKPKGSEPGEWKFTTYLEAVQEESLKGGFQLDMPYHCMCAVEKFRVRTEDRNFFWEKNKIETGKEEYQIEVPISCIRQQIFPSREFMRLTGIKRPEVSFNLAFPELNEYVEKYHNISYASLLRIFEDLIKSGQEYFELFGIKVPSIYLTHGGLGAIIVISFYFWLHLKEMTKLSAKNAWDCSIAWIGMYNSFWAKVLTVISVVVVPLLIAFCLSVKACKGVFWSATNATVLLIFAAEMVISGLLLQRLCKWWQVLTR